MSQSDLSLDASGAAPLGSTRKKVRWGNVLAPYLFISPFILSFLVLFLGPALYSLVLSFFRYRGYGNARWVALDNYIATLNYHVFWTALGNTLFYWIAHVIPLMAIAFLAALLVRSKLAKHKNILKPIIFMPNVVAIVAASLIFQNFFGTQYGVINTLLGVEIPWLQNEWLSKIVIVLLLIWRNVGFWFVVFLAGLTSISPDVEDAARIDGATPWQRLRYVIIPLMRNIFIFAFVIDVINSFQLFTEPNVLMARGGQLAPTDVAPLLNLMVQNLRSGGFGQASAVSWILFLLIAAASFVQFRLLREREDRQ